MVGIYVCSRPNDVQIEKLQIGGGGGGGEIRHVEETPLKGK